MSQHVIKINFPGGFVSAGDLYEILMIAADAGAENIRFGNRQQVYFSVDAHRLSDMETEMLATGIRYEVDTDEYPNIVSSYVCDSIFSQESWLKEGVYRDIFDLFNYQPKLKINIIDRHQTFVPFFSGNFNFISSDVSNYWYWYIRFPKTSKFYCWPTLIYSEDIPAISKMAEELIMQQRNLFYDQQEANEQVFHSMLSKKLEFTTHIITEPLQLPDFFLPYYEGFNKYANKYWLGIYRRTELFPIDFLKDVCSLCIRSRIGQLYTTPWKSILIKDIQSANRAEWGVILDRYHLNIRHASNELNWQLEDLCAEGLSLKQQLVREFEDADLRTFRLTFAIKTRPKTGLMASVVIRKQAPGIFEILHTVNFNPNSKEYISYKKSLKTDSLAAELIKLCNDYHTLSADNFNNAPVKVEKIEESTDVYHELYECRHCKTIYDSNYGDSFNDIAPGIAFELLAGTYVCPICEADKASFELITNG